MWPLKLCGATPPQAYARTALSHNRARNNADWYRLLELCGLIDTLIGDNDGVYHPALFNDRLLLGIKETMSEAELHITLPLPFGRSSNVLPNRFGPPRLL